MNRLHALLLVVMVALLALASLPTAEAASTCSGAPNCATCCGDLENLCSTSCSHNPNPGSCLNRCWATYQTCLAGCGSAPVRSTVGLDASPSWAEHPSASSAAACTLPACNTVLAECNRPPTCSLVSETQVGTCTEDGGQHFKMLITCTCLRGAFCTN